MKNYLIVVDMQKDFIDGSLGTAEAVGIVDAAAERISEFDGKIFATYDTHYSDYLSTAEGAKLPVEHCIEGTDGWRLDKKIRKALDAVGYTPVVKHTFGSVDLPRLIKEDAQGEELSIELIGLCTDICVVSNALLLKAHFPEAKISVRESCCAGVTPQTHSAAISTMKSCQIDII